MKKARRTEGQITGILQEHEAGAKGADLCRKHEMRESAVRRAIATGCVTGYHRKHPELAA